MQKNLLAEQIEILLLCEGRISQKYIYSKKDISLRNMVKQTYAEHLKELKLLVLLLTYGVICFPGYHKYLILHHALI